MNSSAEFDIGPLSWVKDEIELALAQVAAQMQKYASQQDAEVIAEARGHLHQAHGALAIVGLDGVTEFSHAIERLLEALAEREISWSHAVGEAVQSGLAALRRYLDELIGGRPDQPQRLLSVYRQMNEARGMRDTAASDLFFPDLTQRPPKRDGGSVAIDEVAKQGRLKVARLGFERGIDKWLNQKSETKTGGVRDMRNSISMVEAVHEQPASRAFWWVTLAWFDALAAGGIADDEDARKLCARIGAQVRKLLDGAEAVAERLMRDVLFGVASSTTSNEHIEMVRAAYRLREMVAVESSSDDPRETLLREMRGSIGAITESWDQFCAGAAIALPQFHEQSAQLMELVKKIEHTDLARLEAAVANTANLLRKNPLLHSEAMAIEISTALLLTEQAINHFDALDTEFAPQVDAVTSRLNSLQREETPLPHSSPALQALAQKAISRSVLQSSARNLRADLLQVEQALDAYFRDATNTDALNSVAAPLKQIASAFELLGQSRAVQVVHDCAQRINQFATPGHQPATGEFEDVARKISALGFFTDQLKHGSADLDAFLSPAAPVIAAPSVEAELSSMARMSQTMVGVLRDAQLDAPARDSLRKELQQNLESVRDSARLVADEAIEQQADLALDALKSEASPDKIAAALQPLAPASEAANEDAVRFANASAAEVDDELLDIFAAEVLQVLDTVGVSLFRAMAAMQSTEHLAVLRRCFHTLKGSSRMVGLRDFSEAALAVESTLGRHLKSGKAATPELLAMVDTAQRIVSDWVERLQRRANAPDAKPLLRMCEALKEQDKKPAGVAAEAESASTDTASVTLGTLKIARSLYEIYLNEAQEHLSTLEQNWKRLPTQEMIRAAHTLASTSATLGIVPVGNLAQAMERTLEKFVAANQQSDSTQDTTLLLAMRRLATMVRSIAEQRYPDADDDLAARLNDITPAPPAAPVKPKVVAQDQIDDDLLPMFLEESQDLVPKASMSFDGWRKDGNVGAESLQRVLHTLKGSARMTGMAAIGESIHEVESRVAEIQAKRNATPALIDELEGEFDRIVARIEALGTKPDTVAEAQQRPQLRVLADLVDTMVNESGEISISRSRIEGGVKTLRSSLGDLTENVARLRNHLRELEIQAESHMQSKVHAPNDLRDTASRTHDFDPLEMDRFTRLQELTRILAESVNDVATVEHSLMRDLDQVDVALAQQARLSRELTQHLMGVRMVPLGSIAERLQRVVRLTAEEIGKDVAFSIDGGETELDRSVLERVTGPIEHLLRNAVVHGIEAGDRRATAGKSAQGKVQLGLVQAGNEVIISVADDGAGLDYQRLRSEAIKRGVISEQQQATEAQLAQLIYQPGFTTASQLSESAGRGVGMDAVRNETTALGGRIELLAQTGRGTRFELHLPLTLAVIPAVLVRSGARTFAVPSSLVLNASEMKPETMLELRSTEQITWQDELFTLHYLPRLLGDKGATPLPQRRHWVLLLRGGEQRIALEVDALVGNEEVVIKNIGPQLARLPGINGATVLGDGEVVLIINPVALVSAQLNKVTASVVEPVVEQPKAPAIPTVMVVDDSLTVRKISSRLLERAGYRVVTAKDGVDALEQLAEVTPIAMLADIEMPRMDGFELVRRLRADARFKSLPVIMITSRIADKHRNYAVELGVDHYLGKPYDEEALLAMIAEYARK